MKLFCFVVTLVLHLGSLSAKLALESERLTRRFTTYVSEYSQLKKKNEILKNQEINLKDFGAVYIDDSNKSFYLSEKEVKKPHYKLISKAYFHKTIMQKGWDKLSVETYKNVNPYLQSYFAGYLEGRLTANDIYHFYNNIRVNNKNKMKDFEAMRAFFKTVDISVGKKILEFEKMEKKDKEYWSKLILGYSQIKGLKNGYNFQMLKDGQKQKVLEIEDLLILQSDGEIPELLRFFRYARKKLDNKDQNTFNLRNPEYFKNAFKIDTHDPIEFWAKLMWSSKCSAFIKLVKDGSGKITDLLAGHNTWTDFYEMLRTYKHYKFELDGNDSTLSSTEMTFSSYPGCLSSTDDFYLTNHNLLIMETTLEVIDIKLYDHVKKPDEYIPNFMRVMAATRFSKSAEEWKDSINIHNSGTYSSQWMIIDYNVFRKVKETQQKLPKLLYVIEQVPSHITSHDVSHYLYDKTFFGSFNRAFFQETKRDLNQALINELYGGVFDYKGANRGKIFHKLQSKVNDLASLKYILRYNGYKSNNKEFPDDPSRNSPGHGISARYDLGSIFTNLSGAIDCKVTNFELASKMTAIVISGPTTDDNQNLTPFNWEKFKSLGVLHDGVPNVFNFPWITTSPKHLCCENNDIYNWAKKRKNKKIKKSLRKH